MSIKIVHANVKETDATQKYFRDIEAMLSKFDKSRLPGGFEALVYLYAIILMFLLYLKLYKVTLSTVENMEMKVTGCLRRR